LPLRRVLSRDEAGVKLIHHLTIEGSGHACAQGRDVCAPALSFASGALDGALPPLRQRVSSSAECPRGSNTLYAEEPGHTPPACWVSFGSRGCTARIVMCRIDRSKGLPCELLRTPLRRSSQHSASQHSGEAFPTVPHPPKPGYISQRVNARGVVFATCYILQPFAARQGKGRGSGKVYC
jgi:hypothetical protein